MRANCLIAHALTDALPVMIREQDSSAYACEVLEAAPAAAIDKSFAGNALKVRCAYAGAAPEDVKTIARLAFGGSDEFKEALHLSVTESWYIQSLGLSIQLLEDEYLQSPAGNRYQVATTRRTLERADIKISP
jgi:hypothetical protein